MSKFEWSWASGLLLSFTPVHVYFYICRCWLQIFLTLLNYRYYFSIILMISGLWWFMSLSTIFQLYRGGQSYWWRKLEHPEKITDLLQVTDKKLYHIIMCGVHLAMNGVRTHNFSGDRHQLQRSFSLYFGTILSVMGVLH
jgi:hypothetical protein